MLAILNSLNAHNFPIFQSILMILVSVYQNSWFIELFLIKPLSAFVYLTDVIEIL